MADVQPLRTLRYDPRAVGSLEAVIAPPYDVIDEHERGELAARSPFNVVEIDLPLADGGDRYRRAQETFDAWRQQGVLVREREPALWALEQRYTAADGYERARRGFFARVRVEEYGPRRIRPHERTQPGPKEDRLRLTRATRANLSPVFSLFPDDGRAAGALEHVVAAEPFASAGDRDGTVSTIWRVGDPEVIAELQSALADAELLIADGHHRYETARAYAEEVGGDGEHRYVLMFLCSLSDPGLTVFPTHRLLSGLDDARRNALRDAIARHFEVEQVSAEELEPTSDAATLQVGYLDRFQKQPCRLTLKEGAIGDDALPEPYRRLDTAVLEAIVLRGALGMSDEDILERRGLTYSKSLADAREALEEGRCDAAFLLRPTPIDVVREVAVAGEPMPPKSTYFYPKVPTGLVFNLLE